MIWTLWPDWFWRQLGGGPPLNYVCFDLETLGFEVNDTLIWEVGHVVVVDGKARERFGCVLDWSKSSCFSKAVVQELFQKHIDGSLAPRSTRRLTWERITSSGHAPEQTLREWTAQLLRLRDLGFAFVGHNAVRFDEKVLHRHCTDLDVRDDFDLGPNALYDTMVLENLSQMLPLPKADPRPGETLRAWNDRVCTFSRRDVKSNLPTHCVQKYGLQPAGCGNRDYAHNASYDAWLCHCLFEIYRHALLRHRAMVAKRPRRVWRQRNH